MGNNLNESKAPTTSGIYKYNFTGLIIC